MVKVKRYIALEADLSRQLDQMAEAQDAYPSRLMETLIKEALQRRMELIDQVQTMKFTGTVLTGTTLLTLIPHVLV